MIDNALHRMIGERAQIARKKAGLTQEELSDRLGFKDRQILSNIESGKRRVSTDEMLALMKHLGKTLEYFTDPLILVAEGAFCWRANAGPDILNAFEEKARGWIALYRTLGADLREPVNPITPRLPLTRRSTYEDARNSAEQLAELWNLGDAPARKLPEVVETHLRVLLLYVDPPDAISAAACHLPELNTIVINRKDPEGRRAFDFAHEIFHLLTWEAIPPQRIDPLATSGARRTRGEQLADHFAGALLMPRAVVERKWRAHATGGLHERIRQLTSEFGVTSSALKVRLQVLNLLDEGDRPAINETRTKGLGRSGKGSPPPLFSRPFVDRLARGLNKGLLSVRRAARILDMTIEDLRDLFRDYDIDASF